MSLGLAAGRPADDTTWAIGETERGKVEHEGVVRYGGQRKQRDKER